MQGISSRTAQDVLEVFDDFCDGEKRKLNLVVHNFNLGEPQGDTFQERTAKDAALFTSMIKEALKTSATPVKMFRVGKKLSEKPCLLVVTLESASANYDILRSAPQLRDSLNFSNFYINSDLTQKEREQGKKLREELVAHERAGERNLNQERADCLHQREGDNTIS